MGSLQQLTNKKNRLGLSDDDVTKSIEQQEGDQELIGLRRSETNYMSNDKVVLVAECVAFGASASLLKLRSDVFRAMLEVDDDADQEKFEGSRVIRVTDTAEQLECLLTAIYDDGTIIRNLDPTTHGIKTRLHVLLLAHKYRVDNGELAKFASRQLSLVCLPNSLAAWVASSGNPSDGAAPRDTIPISDLLYAIHVARIINAPTMLATSLFLLLPHNLDDLVDHVSDKADLKLLLNARERFSSMALTEIVSDFAQAIDIPHGAETSIVDVEDVCFPERERWLGVVVQLGASAGIFTWTLLDPAGALVPGWCQGQPPKNFGAAVGESGCRECRVRLRAGRDLVLRTIWARIPQVFGIDLREGEVAWNSGGVVIPEHLV